MNRIRLVCMTLLVLAISSFPLVRARVAVPSTQANKWTSASLEGDYYFGDGLGVNCMLHLSQNGMFAFRWTGCLGEYGANEGPFQVNGDELLLKPSKDNPDGFGGTSTRFYPVQWGQRLYLIAAEDMFDFCRKVAIGWDGSGLDDIHGPHYVRLNSQNRRKLGAVSGLPQVPLKFQPVINAGINVRVTRIAQQVVSVNKGSADGIEEGSYLYGSKYSLPLLKVTKVSATRAQAQTCEKGYPLPKIGETFRAFNAKAAKKSAPLAKRS